ncbi:MAG: alpha-hydroxy-acid oxidizing enzyme [Candidatus Marinimicrobia bacterium]|nr:alpha-hydroxy-acid oxidizing enzyme [Candidatus Neomarinimicrobiota bacterium]|tara:strand:+ start:21391 stop:22539 length:1149 start_codon:yes stop_codon:yes gene_type:complete
MEKLSNCYNIEDIRRMAKSRLPESIFHYIDGGSDDEVTLIRNTAAFHDYEFQPRFLRQIDQIDTSINLFGKNLKVPFFLAPTGMSRMFHHGKENAVARSAAKLGTIYSLSTLGTTSLEEISEETKGPKMFQLYILKDSQLTSEFVNRCKAANYDALCLTVDVPVAGNRERDKVTRLRIPPRWTLKTLITHPQWSFNFLLYPDFRYENVIHRVDEFGKEVMNVMDYLDTQLDRTLSWDYVAQIVEQWGGPFVIKGILTPEDAIMAQEIGASAIMISNHGGRQMDGVAAPIDCISPIREVLDDDMELIVDGGVRRGSHIIKALSLGANAVSIGRPYLYGLGAAGEKGVDLVLKILKDELERNMALAGVQRISDLSEDYIKKRCT